MVLKAWNCQFQNSCTSKIQFLVPDCATNNRHRTDHILDQHAKFGENRYRIADTIVRQPICSQTHEHRWKNWKYTYSLSSPLDRLLEWLLTIHLLLSADQNPVAMQTHCVGPLGMIWSDFYLHACISAHFIFITTYQHKCDILTWHYYIRIVQLLYSGVTTSVGQ